MIQLRPGRRLEICFCTVFWAFLSPAIHGANKPDPEPAAAITVDYPSENSVFPADLIPPLFAWRDPDASATAWRIEVSYGGKKPKIKLTVPGERMRVGEIDASCVGAVTPTLTPEQAAARTWRPDAKTWAAMTKESVKAPATVTITGLRDGNEKHPVSRGQVTFRTAKEPVGAPIFFRDVPLIPVPTERGVIKPLPDFATPLIKWSLRYVNQPRSKVMMEGLPTCANCHSFSRDGKWIGLDVDGPQNDKGLYGLVPIQKNTSIRNEYVIKWNSFTDVPANKRFGFMSQVSPDGRFVVTTIGPPGGRSAAGVDDRFYNAAYMDYKFGQVFYPTRGVVAWYSRESGKLKPLPGADDPRYVQSNAVWSPDGKYLVFARAEARDPYSPDQTLAEYANDPNETQIQYDLYRIPFNEGQGGTPERIEGASQNGKSNNFPKVSPDGKWLVWVQCKNGLLMRPDSELYIVPFEGGTPRRLNSNMSPMNSWHSFSPNGRWMVFSSKGRSPYTQMFLTYIDENGQDSPPILIEDATAANRAVNIPEFVNLAPGMLETLDAPATDFYRVFDVAFGLAEKGKFAEAIPEWRKAAGLNPDDKRVYFNLGLALHQQGQPEQAIEQYRKSLEIDSQNAAAHTNLGVALAALGRADEAAESYNKALAIQPEDAKAHGNLATVLIEKGRTAEAIEHLERALSADPKYAEGHNTLGVALARAGQLDAGISHLEQAVELNGESAEYRYNLGRVLAARSRFADAVPHFEKAVALTSAGELNSLNMLAAMYGEVRRFSEASSTAQKALELAQRQGNQELSRSLTGRIRYYEQQATRLQ